MWLIVFGALLATAGSVLMVIGGNQLAKKQSQPLEQKITSVLNQIDKATEGAAPEQQAQLNQIKSEFAAWAQKFTDDNNTAFMEIERQRLEAKLQSIADAEPSVRLFGSALEVLRSYLAAYATESHRDIALPEVKLPQSPIDFRTWRWPVELKKGFGVLASTGEGVAALTLTIDVGSFYDADLDLIRGNEKLTISVDQLMGSARWRAYSGGETLGSIRDLEVNPKPIDDQSGLTDLMRTFAEAVLYLDKQSK